LATRNKTAAKSAGARTAAPRKPTKTAKTVKAAPAAKPTKANGADEGDPMLRRVGGKLPTGSLHTQPREPSDAASLKAKISAVMTASRRLKKLKNSVPRHFLEIGEILQQVRDEDLHTVKGYTSLEKFAEREAGMSPQASSASLRIFETFQPESAAALGFEKLSAALRAMDDTGDRIPAPAPRMRGTRSPIPPHKL
jgi:hypothetical protein